MTSRGMVKRTYAHKKGRAARNVSSSPSQDVGSDSKMSQSVLKRPQRSQESGDNLHHASGAQERYLKRLRRASGAPDSDVSSDPCPFDELDVNDFSTFQTPLPLASTVESPVVKSGPPEQFSPLPVARRILSRTGSRNLKENSRHPRNLASPFSSRPGSVATSPAGKKQRKRPLMTRTLSEQNEQVDPQNDLLRSVNPPRRIQPDVLGLSLRDRRPSVPNSSFLMQEMARQDWLVPPKVLSRLTIRNVDLSALDSSPELASDNSMFFGDPPLAVSTPCHKHTSKFGRVYAPFDGYCSPELVDGSVHGSPLAFQGNTDDVFMTDGTLPHTPDHSHGPTSCSIISDIDLPLNPPSAHGLRAPGKEPKLVSLRPYALPFAQPRNPSGDEEDSLFSPLRSTEYAIDLPPLSSSPDPVAQVSDIVVGYF